jgi:hypothetical protein
VFKLCDVILATQRPVYSPPDPRPSHYIRKSSKKDLETGSDTIWFSGEEII